MQINLGASRLTQLVVPILQLPHASCTSDLLGTLAKSTHFLAIFSVSTQFFMCKKKTKNKRWMETHFVYSVVISCFVGLCAVLDVALVQTVCSHMFGSLTILRGLRLSLQMDAFQQISLFIKSFVSEI